MVLSETDFMPPVPGIPAQSVLDCLADGVCLLDAAGLATYLNPAAENLLGWRQAELAGREFGTFLETMDWNGSRFSGPGWTGLRPVLRQEKVRETEATFRRRDGTCFPVELSMTPLLQAGMMAGTIIVFRDATVRKLRESRLRAGQERFRSLFESNMLGVVFADVYGRIQEANDAFLEMTGHERQDLRLGELDWMDMTPPEYLIPYGEMAERIRRDGCIRAYEKQLVKKSGERVDILWYVALLAGEEDQMVCLIQDISERKRAERALQESESRFRLMADATPMFVGQNDALGQVTYYNRAWLEFTGLPLEEALGDGWMKAMHPDDLPGIHAIGSVAFEKEQGFEFEARVRRADGKYQWVYTIVTPLVLSSGQFTGYIAAGLDIHELKESQVALSRYATELEQSNRMLSEFAAVASHDLQAPLRKVKTFAEMLKQGAPGSLTEEHAGYVNRIYASVMRMQTLIGDLLAMARLSTAEPQRQMLRMEDVFRQVMGDYDDLILETGASVEITGSLALMADAGQMGQLAQNLLDNALKFRKPGRMPHIVIHLEGDGETGQIRVADNGIGFDSENGERIFNMFERLQGVYEHPGTGIGLAICRKIAERHGGSISAAGVPDEGAIFTVLLPQDGPATQ